MPLIIKDMQFYYFLPYKKKIFLLLYNFKKLIITFPNPKHFNSNA